MTETMQLKYENAAFMRCQSCQERVHCKQCGREFAETISERDDVVSAVVDTEKKFIVIEVYPSADEDDILDAMEENGIFV